MRFQDLWYSKEHRFSLGRDLKSGTPFISIPVSNRLVDYEEFYEIDEATLECFLLDPMAALPLVARCRARLEDGRLILPPGTDRGVAI